MLDSDIGVVPKRQNNIKLTHSLILTYIDSKRHKHKKRERVRERESERERERERERKRERKKERRKEVRQKKD